MNIIFIILFLCYFKHTSQSSGRRFRIRHFRSFRVSRYVSAILF